MRIASLLFASLFASLFCLVSAPAQSPRPELSTTQITAIDAFVQHEMTVAHVPGVQVGIYSRGRILLAKGYGLADIELNVPVQRDYLFQSGSVGKQFVSAAIMMLVEEGKLSLTDSITKYFPDAPPAWKPILIQNLLSHTSGLADYEDDDSFNDPNNPFYLRLDFTEDQLAHKFYNLKIENAPGDKWNYRNANYVLLGILIHRITGQFYGDFLQARIFQPLGMAHTRIINDRDIISGRVSGYETDDSGQLKNQRWVSATFNSTADGTLYFNVLDIAKWDEALYTTRLLKQSSLDRMWTVYPLNDGKPNPAGYGFAWMMDTQRGHKRIQHTGSWQGFTCIIARYPANDLTIAVLTNSDRGQPAYFAHVIAGLADSSLTLGPLNAEPDTTPDQTARLSALLTRIVHDQDISADSATPMDEAMRHHVEQIKKALAGIWPGARLSLLKTKTELGSRSLYRAVNGDRSILVAFGMAPDGKVSSLDVFPDREYDDR